MARHRGTYKPENPELYELSRSPLEAFLKCPACFWLDRVRGVKFPSIPAFLLNFATDVLLKKGFDAYRGQEARLLMAEYVAFLPYLPIAISALPSLASKRASPGFVRSTV
jgi:hypothetical protein